jgi:hypothetical protein
MNDKQHNSIALMSIHCSYKSSVVKLITLYRIRKDFSLKFIKYSHTKIKVLDFNDKYILMSSTNFRNNEPFFRKLTNIDLSFM